MKAFGDHGTGVFTSPSAMEQDVREKYGVALWPEATKLRSVFMPSPRNDVSDTRLFPLLPRTPAMSCFANVCFAMSL